MTARQKAAPHQCEGWQMLDRAKGGMYCGACGDNYPDGFPGRRATTSLNLPPAPGPRAVQWCPSGNALEGVPSEVMRLLAVNGRTFGYGYGPGAAMTFGTGPNYGDSIDVLPGQWVVRHDDGSVTVQDDAPAAETPEPPSALNVIFDGPPGHESGRFVEVETDDGASVTAGDWTDRGDGTWALRLTMPSSPASDTRREDVARALFEHDRKSFPNSVRTWENIHQAERDAYLDRSDVVLAVLPAPPMVDDDTRREDVARAEQQGAQRGWDECLTHVARTAQVGSAGLPDECYEGGPSVLGALRALPSAGEDPVEAGRRAVLDSQRPYGDNPTISYREGQMIRAAVLAVLPAPPVVDEAALSAYLDLHLLDAHEGPSADTLASLVAAYLSGADRG